ncbi:MAG: hypothetical protein AAF528_09470 [Cyanobacteria bacterium P01_C01_bin.121]
MTNVQYRELAARSHFYSRHHELWNTDAGEELERRSHSQPLKDLRSAIALDDFGSAIAASVLR